MSKQLSIWWGGKVAGFLYLNDYGDMGFSYAPEWLEDADAPALSFSLPKQVEPFSRRVCHSFFGGILPEEGQRSAIARALGVSAGNEFQLLEYLGGEVAGALMLLPEGQLPPAPVSGTPIFLMMSICCNYCSICRAAL